MTVSNNQKHIVVPKKFCAAKTERTFSIEFESLFTDALGNGSDDITQRDYTRFQTHPEAAKELLKCGEIKSIVDCIQATINQQVDGYVSVKLSFCTVYLWANLKVCIKMMHAQKPRLQVTDPSSPH
jgi:hypothetical protein